MPSRTHEPGENRHTRPGCSDRPWLPLVREAHRSRESCRRSARSRFPGTRGLRTRTALCTSKGSSIPLDQPLREELAPAPDWPIQLLVPERGQARSRTVPEGSRAYGLGALRRELQRLSQAREGTRNHPLNVAWFNMGRLVAAGAICEQEAAAALIEQGQRIGLGATECERTVASGISAGMQSPRSLAR